MADRWNNLIEKLPQLYTELDNAVPMTGKIGKEYKDVPGVYILLDCEGPRYVGRTKRLRQRIQDGHRSKAKNNGGNNFAFSLAKDATPSLAKDQKGKKSTRKDLMERKEFYEIFKEKVCEIEKMDVKFLEICCYETRFLLEFYATLKLGLSTSSFEEH